MFEDRVDWGECEGCDKVGCLLTPFVHRPTKQTVWLCQVCSHNAREALEREQVPGLLEEKINKALWISG